jgi:hypothetical protein
MEFQKSFLQLVNFKNKPETNFHSQRLLIFTDYEAAAQRQPIKLDVKNETSF